MADVRLINANALTEYFIRLARSMENARYFSAADAVRGAAVKVASAPTIDAVPVVRCRECKYAEKTVWSSGEMYCRVWKMNPRPDGFCHMGAKMDGGAEG